MFSPHPPPPAAPPITAMPVWLDTHLPDVVVFLDGSPLESDNMVGDFPFRKQRKTLLEGSFSM